MLQQHPIQNLTIIQWTEQFTHFDNISFIQSIMEYKLFLYIKYNSPHRSLAMCSLGVVRNNLPKRKKNSKLKVQFHHINFYQSNRTHLMSQLSGNDFTLIYIRHFSLAFKAPLARILYTFYIISYQLSFPKLREIW